MAKAKLTINNSLGGDIRATRSFEANLYFYAYDRIWAVYAFARDPR